MKKKAVNPRLRKPYGTMTVRELNAEVEKFDHEMIGTPGRPLTRSQKTAHRRAKNKVGRPTVGRGAKRLMITMEKQLLSEADALAKKRKLSRSQLIAVGVRTLLKAG